MDYFKKAQDIFSNTEYVKTLKLKLLDVTEDTATCEFEVEKFHTNYFNGLHGGVISGVVDTISFFPGKLLPSGIKLTTSNFEMKYFRPANIGDHIIVTAEIIHFGKRKITVSVKGYFKKNKKLISLAMVDLMVIN